MNIIAIDSLWQLLSEHQNETFYTVKKLPFSYVIKGGELFVDRRNKSITKATFKQALDRLREEPDKVTGPKSLNVFGAPYIWALFQAFEIV
ncbi:MAG: hypothetical protein NC429_04175 [Lachnospiraceae bacterium]|nr:hypothetical protein [Lachnospiraceae bacterium]